MAALSPLAFAVVVWGTVALVLVILAYEVYTLLYEVRSGTVSTR